jgi:hypothetical protein
MIEELAQLTGIPESEILGGKRDRKTADVRQMYWYLLRRSGYSYPAIGRLCGRNHSTIVNGCRHIRSLLDVGDKDITELYELIKGKFMSGIKRMIEIELPEYPDKKGEVFTIRDIPCGRCNGIGHFYPTQTGRDEYEENTCPVCKGVGKMQAKIVVGWLPDNG